VSLCLAQTTGSVKRQWMTWGGSRHMTMGCTRVDVPSLAAASYLAS
jgi:hypothetical protein